MVGDDPDAIWKRDPIDNGDPTAVFIHGNPNDCGDPDE